MKAITLWQPWASLVAAGVKEVETRSWRTSHRGLLAIHAAGRMPPAVRVACVHNPDMLRELLAAGLARRSPGGATLAWISLGVVVAICRLADCTRIAPGIVLPGEPERSLGDYRLGRWMWMLRDIHHLLDPIPARGSQGIWTWEPPAGLLESLGL